MAWLIFIVWIAYDFNFLKEAKKIAREDIANIYRQIDLGSSMKNIEDILSEVPTGFSIYKRKNYWTVRSPGELGATEWLIVIKFDNDQLVKAAGIRIGDGNYHPRCAPLDKVSSEYTTWEKPYKELDCILEMTVESAV